MATDIKTRSRRAVLAGLGGGLAALAAQTLGRPLPAFADGETIRVGGVYNTSETPTVLRNRVNNKNDVFVAQTEDVGIPIRGKGGPNSPGVMGEGGVGVFGRADVRGVWGVATRPDEGVGLAGYGDQAGVYGEGRHFGVDGWGVSLDGTPAVGIRGVALQRQGVAVRGDASEGGTAIVAYNPFGMGLRVEKGRVSLDQVSGLANIRPGRASTTFSPGVRVTADAFVLLTARVNLNGRDIWYTTDPRADMITIHISEPRPNHTPIAWLLLG